MQTCNTTTTIRHMYQNPHILVHVPKDTHSGTCTGTRTHFGTCTIALQCAIRIGTWTRYATQIANQYKTENIHVPSAATSCTATRAFRYMYACIPVQAHVPFAAESSTCTICRPRSTTASRSVPKSRNHPQTTRKPRPTGRTPPLDG